MFWRNFDSTIQNNHAQETEKTNLIRTHHLRMKKRRDNPAVSFNIDCLFENFGLSIQLCIILNHIQTLDGHELLIIRHTHERNTLGIAADL